MRLRNMWIIAAFLAACSGSENERPKTSNPAPTTENTQISPADKNLPIEDKIEPDPIAPLLKTIGGYTVDTARDCDGYPRLKLRTPDGLCVGLVASKETPALDGKSGFKFPRDIVFPKPEHRLDNEFYVTDMGGWGENRGRVLLVNNGQIETVMDGLMLPHAIEYGPDNHIYVAEADQLIRFVPPPSKLDGFGYETVISNLPYKPGGAKHLHPLKAFTFEGPNSLWVNSGSLSDRCLGSLNTGLCTEYGNAAAVLNFQKSGDSWALNPDATAAGLRNSMGLATHNSGTILQVENGADFKDAGSPYEEINLIDTRRGQPNFYGWPYCYDRDKQDPAWGPEIGYNCSTHNPDYMQPIALLPPHGAPLDLLYAPAGTLNFKGEKLIVPLHGYRETAHRILYYDVDEQGLPLGEAKELVFDWAASDTGPRGAPAGLTIGPDGAIWGVEDKNKTIFRIAVDKYPPQIWNDTNITVKIEMDAAYPKLQTDIFKPKCAACHSEFLGDPQTSFEKLQRVGWLASDSSLYTRLTAKPPKQMPPDTPLPQSEIDAIRIWLQSQN